TRPRAWPPCRERRVPARARRCPPPGPPDRPLAGGPSTSILTHAPVAPWQVAQHDFADHQLERHVTERATVLADVRVVAQHEEAAWPALGDALDQQCAVEVRVNEHRDIADFQARPLADQ